MASGVPVVASGVGGVPEFVVEGETGLLVPPEDVSALVNAIGRLHDEPGLAASLASKGRRQAEAHSWALISERYGEVYREVLLRHPKGATRLSGRGRDAG